MKVVQSLPSLNMLPFFSRESCSGKGWGGTAFLPYGTYSTV